MFLNVISNQRYSAIFHSLKVLHLFKYMFICEVFKNEPSSLFNTLRTTSSYPLFPTHSLPEYYSITNSRIGPSNNLWNLTYFTIRFCHNSLAVVDRCLCKHITRQELEQLVYQSLRSSKWCEEYFHIVQRSCWNTQCLRRQRKQKYRQLLWFQPAKLKSRGCQLFLWKKE